MNETEWNDWNNSLKDKLGDENYTLISGELGELLTRNNSFLEEKEKQENEIANLKETNQKLSHANAQLLQSIPVANFEKPDTKKEEVKDFSFLEQFDEFGKFKR